MLDNAINAALMTMLAVDSYSRYDVPVFQSAASIPPICDIPITEVNRKLYGKPYQADSSEADHFS